MPSRLKPYILVVLLMLFSSAFLSCGPGKPLSAAILKRTDTVYLDSSHPELGYVHPNQIMIVNVEDSVKVIRAVKGLGLHLLRIYAYCGKTHENYNRPTVNDTYLVVRADGKPLSRRESVHLSELRTLLGDDHVGPVVIDAGPAKALSHQIELSFVGGTPEHRRSQVLKQFGLHVYYRDGNSTDHYIAEAERGMGSGIISIVRKLKAMPEVLGARTLLHSRICTTG